MFSAIAVLLALPAYVDWNVTNKLIFAPFSSPHKVLFWLFAGVFLVLLFLGSRPASAPYVGLSKLLTALYFCYFLVLLTPLSAAAARQE
jgi:ubiquinol-cytochrome c reductase cytochrome b/c1 subunit